jgi:predicted transcriptional regulator|tara:strand:- start:276 stop:572 length:297 start_codon:yes stop_codon:yes gene_type:complete
MVLSNLRREIEIVERHSIVLDLVSKNGPVGIIKLSTMSDLPQHKIRYSLRVLEQKGLIVPSQKGALSTKKAKQYRKKMYKESTLIMQNFQKLINNMEK